VERDFKDEQAYGIDKNLLHNRQLHGCGVVCGLQVVQHESPDCQTRYLCIEPGTAIDCCGHEIIVPEKECVDITQLPAIKALQVELDVNGQPLAHRLQICLRYRECPTEEIPVLYNDCGCDGTECAPNRILESYDVDVLVDEPDEPKGLLSPRFERKFTIPLDEAVAVALDEAGGSLYVLAGEVGGTISRVNLADGTISPQSHTMPAGQKCHGITLSEDGKRLYAALDPVTSGNPVQLRVIDTDNLSAPKPIRMVDVPGSAGGLVYMARAGGKLLTLAGADGKLHVWGVTVDAAPVAGDPPLAPEATVDLGVTGVVGLAVGGGGKSAYTLDPDPTRHRVLAVDLSASPPKMGTDIAVLPPGATPLALAVVTTTGPDRLAVATDARNLHLLAVNQPELLGTSTNLAHMPVALTVSPGGQWAYVLETDVTTGESFIQAVNVYKLGLKQSAIPGAVFPIGPGARNLSITAAGDRLYVPYVGTAGPPPISGGVALVDVLEQDCEEILWRHLAGCPGCDDTSCMCVVLATIENYVPGSPGFAMRDVEKPPTRPEDDKANRISRIDNRRGRRLLPSTQTLLELIECAMDKAPGAAGKQGPPGDPGPGIDDVVVTVVPCGQVPQKPTIGPGPNGRTLFLELPSELDDLDVDIVTTRCDDDPSGKIVCDDNGRKLVLQMPPGLKDLRVEVHANECGTPATGKVISDEQGCKLVLDIPTGCKEIRLPHIVAINWPHDGTLLRNDAASQRWFEGFFKLGLVIAFDTEMLPETINRHTVQVLFNHMNRDTEGNCFCNMRGRVRPGRVITEQHGDGLPECGDNIVDFKPYTDSEIKAQLPATGAQFFPDNREWIMNAETEYQIVAKGDFILAHKEDPEIKLRDGKPGRRALDGDHLGPGLPLRCPTGDGVEGGTFESWFGIYREKPLFLRLDMNEATREELLNVRGVGPVMLERINAARDERPFTDLEDFRTRVGLSDRDWERIRPEVKV
jgi:DNA-binding beta-propeller fold protein YncE